MPSSSSLGRRTKSHGRMGGSIDPYWGHGRRAVIEPNWSIRTLSVIGSETSCSAASRQAGERESFINNGDNRRHGIAVIGRPSIITDRDAGDRMSLSPEQQFEAKLPGLSNPIRIMAVHDAEVFTCRWTIRDKDPALKALLREMQSANSSAATMSVILKLKQALASRRLLGRVGFA